MAATLAKMRQIPPVPNRFGHAILMRLIAMRGAGVAEFRLLQALDCNPRGRFPIEISPPEEKFNPDLKFRRFDIS
jgi:hypothetical protein